MTAALWKRLEALEGSGGAETFIRWRTPGGGVAFQALRAGAGLLDAVPAGARVIAWPVPLPRFEVVHAHA